MTQVDFHRARWHTIGVTGAAMWTPGRLELMTIRHKAQLARSLVIDLGADSRGIFHRMHGSRSQDLLEDKGYFFGRAVATAPDRVRTSARPSLHYAVVRDESGGRALHGGRIAQAGSYTIVEYQPLIDYSTFRCSENRGKDSRSPGDEAEGDWTPVQFPTAGPPQPAGYGLVPHRRWRSSIVSCRGTLSVSQPLDQRLRIVVSLRSDTVGDHAVNRFSVNRASVEAAEVLAHSTFAAHNMDAVFDVTELLREGRNELMFQISSRTSRFDLDVYELVVERGADRRDRADRLDPEPPPVLVEERDHHLARRSSSVFAR
jgi:hypothetical protein